MAAATSSTIPSSTSTAAKALIVGNLLWWRPAPSSRSPLQAASLRALMGDFQGPHAAEVHPHAAAAFDDLHQGVVTVRAAQHDPGTPEDVHRPDCPAAPQLPHTHSGVDGRYRGGRPRRTIIIH